MLNQTFLRPFVGKSRCAIASVVFYSFHILIMVLTSFLVKVVSIRLLYSYQKIIRAQLAIS